MRPEIAAHAESCGLTFEKGNLIMNLLQLFWAKFKMLLLTNNNLQYLRPEKIDRLPSLSYISGVVKDSACPHAQNNTNNTITFRDSLKYIMQELV